MSFEGGKQSTGVSFCFLGQGLKAFPNTACWGWESLDWRTINTPAAKLVQFCTVWLTTKHYEQLVGWCAKQTFKQPLTCELAVYIDVYVKNNVFSDIDNIAKSVLDGMQEIAYENDRQICFLTIQRIRGKDEYVEVRIEPKIEEAC